MNLEPALQRRVTTSVRNMMTPPRPFGSWRSLPAGCSPRPRCQADPGVAHEFCTQPKTPSLAGPLVGPIELLAVPNATPSRRHFDYPNSPFSRTGGAGPVSNQTGEALTPLGKRAGQPPRLNEASRRRPAGPAADAEGLDGQTVCHSMHYPDRRGSRRSFSPSPASKPPPPFTVAWFREPF